jgi:hypothetical protein
MTIGFTGTQSGMTLKQQGEVMRWLNRLLVVGQQHGFVHGMCIGADEQAHKLAWALKYVISGWPANVGKTMNCNLAEFARVHDPKPPLERNHDIVGESDLLIAAPRERAEVQRSGTWATIRYARARGLTTLMVWP